jgi:hypothetical protein
MAKTRFSEEGAFRKIFGKWVCASKRLSYFFIELSLFFNLKKESAAGASRLRREAPQAAKKQTSLVSQGRALLFV